MTTPIPGLAAQVYSSGETMQVSGSSPTTLIDDHYYYFVSNRTAATNGQSLLKAIKDQLDAISVSLSTVWTLTLAKHVASGTYRVNVSHSSGTSKTITFQDSLATALGFASGTIVVATATTVVADYPSFYWWTPDRPVSLTGTGNNDAFDPSEGYGVPMSAGATQRSPDGTVAIVENGVLYDATYRFNMVEGLYLIKKTKSVTTYTNRDLETFWLNNFRKGRKLLWWRDRDNATGSNAPSEGSGPAYNYVEYSIQEATRGKIPAKQTTEYNTRNWDVTFDLFVTEHGDTPLTD